MSMFTKSDRPSDRHEARQDQGGPPSEAGGLQHPEPTPGRRRDSSPSVISTGLKVTGNLDSEDEIQIDGRVEGDVRAKTVTVGEGASVKGSVYGESVQLAGTIEGKIEGRNVAIKKSGHMEGDIIHETLEIEANAYVDGHCRPQFGKSQQKAGAFKAGAVDTAQKDRQSGASKQSETASAAEGAKVGDTTQKT